LEQSMGLECSFERLIQKIQKDEDDSVYSRGDHLTTIDKKIWINLKYPTVDLVNETLISELRDYALVDMYGSGSKIHYCTVGETKYGVCTTKMDIIFPCKVVLGSDNTYLYNSKTPIQLIEKWYWGGKEVILSPTDEKPLMYPPRVRAGNVYKEATGIRFMLGICQKKGEVLFPYDKMKSKIPLEVGESILIGLDEKSGEWRIIDVSSRARLLRLCLLAAEFSMDCRGPALRYALGIQYCTISGKKEDLQRIRLMEVDGVEYPEYINTSDEDRMKLFYEGCCFNVECVYGGVQYHQQRKKCGDSEVPKQFQMFNDCRIEFHGSKSQIHLFTNVNMLSVDIGNLGGLGKESYLGCVQTDFARVDAEPPKSSVSCGKCSIDSQLMFDNTGLFSWHYRVPFWVKYKPEVDVYFKTLNFKGSGVSLQDMEDYWDWNTECKFFKKDEYRIGRSDDEDEVDW